MVEDVELCLEVQVDPDSKKILSNPEKCKSALLDVTVLKPKELEAFGTQRTNTLTAAEVRKLISSLEKQRRKKQKVLDKLKQDDIIVKVRKHEDTNNNRSASPKRTSFKRKENISPISPIDDLERKDFIGITESVEPLFCEIRRSLKNVETRITNMQDINLVVSQTTVDESASEEFITKRRRKSHTPFTSCNHLKNPSVYRVETTPRDLRSVLVCENRRRYRRNDKIEGKCLCENCGIVGLLMECQKHPLMSELSESPSPSSLFKEMKQNKKKTNFYVPNSVPSKTKLDEFTYVNQLKDRVKLLEDRLALQEEKIVPKEYFKKIMSKVLTNFSSSRKLRSKSNVSVVYLEKQKSKKDERSKENKSVVFSRSRHHSKESHAHVETKKTYAKSDKATLTEEDGLNYTWKWGEEILKPGIDLKNRIVTLLNDMLNKFPSRERCSGGSNYIGNDKKDELTSETIKKFIEHVNTKVFNAQVDTKVPFSENRRDFVNLQEQDNTCHRQYHANKEQDNTYRHYHTNKEPDNTYRQYHTNKEQDGTYRQYRTKEQDINYRQYPTNKEHVKNVDVSYINPKLTNWRRDSRNEFKGKQEFLKIAAKAKQYQKDILWKNIWTQAKANGQNKNDKITIKIPVQNKHNKEKTEMFETELTIKEVEAILKGRY